MKNFTKYLLLFASLLLVIGCNNREAKSTIKSESKQQLFNESPLAQPGSIDYLIYKNGFKIFKLGDNIDNYIDKIKPADAEEDLYIVTDTSLLSIGDNIKLEKLTLKTEKDIIKAIVVLLNETYATYLLNTLTYAYGEPNNSDPSGKSWYYNKPDILLYYTVREGYAIAVFQLDKNINYEKLKKIRQIEREAEKYVKDL